MMSCGKQLLGVANDVGRVFRLELLDTVEPIGMGILPDLRVQLAQHPLQVSDDRHIDLDVLADFRGVDVYVYLLGLQGECARLAGDAVVEAHPQGDQQIGLLDGEAGIGHAVHTRHSDAQDVIVGERANAQQGRDDRNLRLLGQLAKLGVRPGEDDAVAGEDNRLLGLVYQLDGLLDLAVVSLQVRLVAGKVYFQGLVVLVERVVRELDLLDLHVLGHVDDNRTRPAGAGDVEGFLHNLRDLGGVHNQGVVLGDREGDARGVSLLEGVGTNGGAGHLSDHSNDRNGVHLGRRDAGYEVGRSGAGRGPAYADFACYAGVTVGGVGGALLVTSENVSKLRVLRQRLVEGQDCSAGKTEDVYDALTYKALAQQLRSIHSNSHDIRTSRLRSVLFTTLRDKKKVPSHQRDGTA